LRTSDSPAAPRAGLSNVVDIVVSPDAAFARLREVPAWGWAFLVASVLGVAGSLVVGPAIAHAMDVSLPAQLAASPQVAKMPADQQATFIANYLRISHIFAQWSFVAVPFALLIAGLVQGVIMLIANAAGKGDGSFRKLFALSITVTVVGEGLRSIAFAAIVLVRGTGSFDSITAVQQVVPSLALLAPGAHGALAGFLGGLNVFYLWAAALLALGMQRVARISPVAAWSTAVVMLLLTACFAAFGASRGG